MALPPMIDLEPGDIVLAKGRRLRHRLSRKLLGINWNHVLLIAGGTMTLELTWERGIVVGDMERYWGKQIVILRRRQNSYIDSSWMNSALASYDETINFDWLGFLLDCCGLPLGHRRGKILCDVFAQEIYAKAGVHINFRNIMADALRGSELHCYDKNLKTVHTLTKIFDYRDYECKFPD